jgi:CO dehydrogenase/acetyl-CoA synthase beta subunit
MSVFDAYIQKVAEYVEGLRTNGWESKEFSCFDPPDKIKEGLPVRVGPDAQRGIILRSDTYLELGNPLAGSCAFVLWTDKPSLIHDGKITLLGPDIPESADGSLPFAQILIVGGGDLSDRDHEALVQHQYISDRIEGYMIKSAPDRVWSRVSREVAAKGFDFETLGKALIGIVKSEEPRVEAMEILFVTQSKEAVQGLANTAAQIRKISKDIVKENWKIRGYDIECASDCSSCGEKQVCDDIRDVISIKKRKKKVAQGSEVRGQGSGPGSQPPEE